MSDLSSDAPPPLSREAREDVETIAKGGATQIIGQITSRGVSFFFTLVATNVVGIAGYGSYRKALQILTIASQFGLAGFNYSAMHFMSRARASKDPAGLKGAARVSLIGAAIVSTAVLAVLLIAAKPLADSFKGDSDELARLIRIGAPYVPLFALMQVLRYCTQAYRTMVPSVIVGNIIQPVARFVIGVAFLVAGLEVAGLLWSLVASAAIGLAAGVFYFRKMLTERQRAAVPRFDVGKIVRFALPQGGSSLLGIQSLGLGIIILGFFEADRAVGLFGVALALQGPGGVFLGGIVNIWAPVVSELYDKRELGRLEALYQTITRWVITFSFPVFAVLILEADVFLRLFAPGAVDGAGAVAILAVGNFFYTGTGPTGYVLSMSGRPGVNFVNSFVAVILYIVLGLVIVPEHGLVGMAVVDSAVTALVNTARVIEAKILVGVQPFGRSLLKPIGAMLLGALVLLLWRLIPGRGTVMDVAGIAIAAGVYVGALGMMGLDAEERYVWQRIKQRAFKKGAR